MAALGKIRSKGKVLAIIIGLALFAFIAEELFRSCESTRNDQRQTIGKVLGKRVNVQEFQALFDEYQEIIKLQRGSESLGEDELNQVKDAVWNTFVQTKILENETSKLGIEVTDEELQNVLNEGTNLMLRQTPFVDQQTGLFDANQLKKFLADYKAQQKSNSPLARQSAPLYHYWTFVEKSLRRQLLARKYETLFMHCLLSNPAESKALYDAGNEEAKIVLASFPYADVDDAKIKVEDADLKKKYEEVKALSRQYTESRNAMMRQFNASRNVEIRQFDETRNIKFIDVVVDASPADRVELQNQFDVYTAELEESDNPAEVVRTSTSLVNYLGLPVKKDAYPSDIARMIDSLSVGQTSKVFETKRDNTLNVMKLISVQNLPDSVEYRQIQVFADSPEASRIKADSIYNALQGGADFELIAKNYGQTGETNWLTTAQYQSSPSLDADTKEYLTSLNTMSAGEVKNLALDQGNIVIQVVNRKAFVDKYILAVVKKTIDFSHETYSSAYNKFANFVSKNQSAEDVIKNAEGAGYAIRDFNNLTTSNHNIANIRGTRDALKWVFDAKEGSVSPMYECGDNNHLLVVVLDKVNKKGYRSPDDEQVKEYLNSEVVKEKKADIILADIKGVKSINDAVSKGAKTDTIPQITFSSPVFVRTTGANEAQLAGAVASTGKGQFSKKPVVGDAGVYVFQVIDKTEKADKYDAEQMKVPLKQKAMQAVGNYMNELFINAEVVDNRYIFF